MHPRVVPQPRVQLAVPDIHGPDLGRAAGQQHLGEAARRGAEVERHQTGGVDAEDIERMHELQRRARDPGQRVSGHGQHRSGGHPQAGLVRDPAVQGHHAGGDQRLRPRPARRQPFGHQRLIEPAAQKGTSTGPVAT